MGWDGMGLDGIGWDWMGLDGMGLDGIGWDGYHRQEQAPVLETLGSSGFPKHII